MNNGPLDTLTLDDTETESSQRKKFRTKSAKISPRTASRLASVQALYAMGLTNKRPSEVIADFRNGHFNDEENSYQDNNLDLDYTITILHGVVREQRVIDHMISDTLPDSWNFKRLDKVMCAILRAGIYELLFSPDIPSKVVINEYTNIAASFQLTHDNSMINGILNAVARMHNLIED